VVFRFLFRYLFLIPVFLCGVSSEPRNYKKDVESYLKGLRYLSSDFVQKNPDGSVYTGHICISKERESRNARIDYEECIPQKILIKNDMITIIDLETKKSVQYSVKQAPVYGILNNGINLEKEDCAIDNSDPEYVKIAIRDVVPSGSVCVTLVFSKYKNGNIKNLEGWIIGGENDQKTAVSFFPDTLSVNDKNQIPDKVFED
jgi:outer membrane lipoprotein-sorting protein